MLTTLRVFQLRGTVVRGIDVNICEFQNSYRARHGLPHPTMWISQFYCFSRRRASNAANSSDNASGNVSSKRA